MACNHQNQLALCHRAHTSILSHLPHTHENSRDLLHRSIQNLLRHRTGSQPQRTVYWHSQRLPSDRWVSHLLSSNNFINELSNDWTQILPKIQQHQNGFFLFIGPFAIALVLLLLLLPFLSCCCCCPNCCPPACCRLPNSQLYSKCELRWPAIMAILSLLLAIGASAYGT